MLKNIKILLFVFIFLNFMNFAFSNQNFFEEGKKKFNEKKLEESKFIFQRNIVKNKLM